MANQLSVLQPGSIAEATRLLADLDDDARVVAGSTAITLLLRQRLIAPRWLVSLGAIAGLDSISIEDGWLRIGALVRHRDVELSPVVRTGWRVLAEAFGSVANVRIRNVATVGGVLAEADYASDPPAVFVALDAEVHLAGPAGTRTVTAHDFFQGFYATALAADEIVTAVRVPPAPAGAVYEKYRSRSSEDRPCVGVAAVAQLAQDRSTCHDLRVVVGAASDKPERVSAAESLGRGQFLTEEVAAAIADAYAAHVDTLSDLRGSSWYRTEMIRVWVRRGILHAVQRARAE
ncbi:MAG: xanthine dehydrogenase family protein subunit M [Chloroflexi bacterium]|nr:xanthine dehydrogenase family protein subunit M [Chloroflexota bacterium]